MNSMNGWHIGISFGMLIGSMFIFFMNVTRPGELPIIQYSKSIVRIIAILLICIGLFSLIGAILQ